METIAQIDNAYCYGCGACTYACAKGAIHLREDENGYYKKSVDVVKCVGCGVCLKVCPYVANPPKLKLAPSYATYCKNGTDTLRSTSGGVAYQIAKICLERSYAVIGAAWSEDFQSVEHIVVKEAEQLDRLRKSKYVQSRTEKAFMCLADLEKVVVFGSPCQISGLRNLYGDREGLVLVDLDCMGPSGLNLWRKYLDYISAINGSGICSVEMRNKKISWMTYGTKVDFQDGTTYFQDKYHDPFCKMFHLANVIQSTCREHCKFHDASAADIRIGDAWHYTDGFDKKTIHDGISLITPQTKLGAQIVSELADSMVMKAVTREEEHYHPQRPDSKLMECINDPEQTIMDAVKLYDSVRLDKRIVRWLSYILSYNDSVYLYLKKICKRKK